MKLLNEIKDKLKSTSFELEHERRMVQSRILSPILEEIEHQGITQTELEEKTGLKQPFLSALFHTQKPLNMKHIALLQKALGIVLQPPKAMSSKDHFDKFYTNSDQEDISEIYKVLLDRDELYPLIANATRMNFGCSDVFLVKEFKPLGSDIYDEWYTEESGIPISTIKKKDAV